MSRSLIYPTEEELRKDYRENRSIFGRVSFYPRFYQFFGSIEDEDIDEKRLVILSLDVMATGLTFDGNRTISFPSTDMLTLEVMIAIARLGTTLVFSVNFLRDDGFVAIMQEHCNRFSHIWIYNPDKLTLADLGLHEIYKTPKYTRFNKRFKAQKNDVSREFQERLEIYEGGLGYGLGLTCCIATAWVGVPLFFGSLLALTGDAIVTGIRYSVMKK